MRAVAVVVLAVGALTCGQAWAADEFEVLPDVYGSCIAVNKSPEGNVRNDCMTSASIYNRTNGSIYACDAHIAVNVEGMTLNATVAYKKAHCGLANPPTHPGGTGYSAGYKGDFAPRRSPAGGATGTVPARFFWRTRSDKLEADVCVDFVGFKAYSGCIDASLQTEAPPQK